MNIIGRIIFNKIKLQHLTIPLQIRPSSYNSSPLLSDLQQAPHIVQYDRTQCPIDWSFVERILPPKIVPNPTPKSLYSSGWKPANIETTHKAPYFIERNKNHMLPVYMEVNRFGTRKITKVRRIRGDIWALFGVMEGFLQKHQVRPIRGQVNELTRCIQFYGDWVNALKHWLTKNGF